jgi:hypothetical protein
MFFSAIYRGLASAGFAALLQRLLALSAETPEWTAACSASPSAYRRLSRCPSSWPRLLIGFVFWFQWLIYSSAGPQLVLYTLGPTQSACFRASEPIRIGASGVTNFQGGPGPADGSPRFRQQSGGERQTKEFHEIHQKKKRVRKMLEQGEYFALLG